MGFRAERLIVEEALEAEVSVAIGREYYASGALNVRSWLTADILRTAP